MAITHSEHAETHYRIVCFILCMRFKLGAVVNILMGWENGMGDSFVPPNQVRGTLSDLDRCSLAGIWGTRGLWNLIGI